MMNILKNANILKYISKRRKRIKRRISLSPAFLR